MTTQSTEIKPKAKILYIEDNPLNAKLVQRVLGSDGYSVVIAETGLLGIDAAVATQPDLILMDINLPDLSGREVTTRLRAMESFKKTPIVALTALTDERQRAMTIAAGVDGYITKPFEVEELVQRVSFHLQGGKEVFGVMDMGEAQKQYNQEIVAHLERKLRQAQDANEELQRMDKMKDDFIQRVAHELRTPLTIIYGYGRLIQSAEQVTQLRPTQPDFAAYVDGLVESIERMHGIVNEILTIYRIATGEVHLTLSLVNLQELVEKAVRSFDQATIQRNIKIEFDKDEWPKTIQADGEMLKLVMNNLIGNAIKYTPDGGKVTLKAEQNFTLLKMSVTDTGIGISREDQTRVFETFYSASETDTHSTSKTAFRGGGLGLGLSISRHIVAAHGGHIRVESEGKDEQKLPGSTFVIELPMRKTYQEVSGSATRPLNPLTDSVSRSSLHQTNTLTELSSDSSAPTDKTEP